MVESRGYSARLLAQIGGSAQLVGGSHTLVSFGNGAGVQEYDGTGSVAWQLDGNPGYVFRGQRIRSLSRREWAIRDDTNFIDARTPESGSIE